MEKTCAASLRRFFHLFPEQRSKLSFNSLGSQLRREGGIPEVHESSVPPWRHTQRHHGSSSQRLFIALEPRPMPSTIGPITDGDGIGEGVVFICGKHGGNIFRCVLPRVGKWQAVPQIVDIFSLSSAAARSFASDSCYSSLQVHAFAKGPSDAQIKWSYCSIYRIPVIVIVETISAVSFSLCFRGLQIGTQMPHS